MDSQTTVTTPGPAASGSEASQAGIATPAQPAGAAAAGASGAPTPGAEPKPNATPKHELRLPEGSHMDQAALEKFASFAKERGLSPEQAQSVLERDHAERLAFVEGQKAAYAKQEEGWLAELKADKEFGGEKLAETSELAKRALARFGPELAPVLDETRLGNFPANLKAWARVGQALAEDRLASVTFAARAAPKTLEERLREHYEKSLNRPPGQPPTEESLE